MRLAPSSRAPLALAIALAFPLSAHALAAEPAPAAAGADSGADASKKSRKLKTVEVVGELSPSSTSPKYTQPLLDTPQTVTIIPSAIYEAQAQTTLRDALRNTPGITIQAGEGGAAPGDNVYVRGFTARNDVSIDGVRDPGVVSRDLFNVDQIEVAKGPASAITGRGSTGGAINLATKMARLDEFTRVDLTAGTDAYGRATLDHDRTVGETGAVRINLMWQNAGVPGRDEVERRSWGLAPSFALGLGTDTRFYLNLVHAQQDNLPDYGLPVVLPANVSAGSTIADLDWSNFYGLLARDREEVRTDSATFIFEHDFNDHVSLRSLTRAGRNDRDAIVTAPRAAANATQGTGFDPAIPQVRRNDMKSQDRGDAILAHQTSISASWMAGRVKHDLVAGVELAREKQDSYTRVEASGLLPPVADLFDPDPRQPYDSAVRRNGAATHARGDTMALFAFDTLSFNEHWLVSGGLRWERFDVDFTSIATPAAPATAGVETDFTRSDDMLSWRAGLVYKPVATGSLYLAAGSSFNPVADGNQGIVLGASGANDSALGPEKSRTVELGLKWEWFGGRLNFSGAVFDAQKTNARANDGLGNTVLAGNQRIQGVELGMAGEIRRGWNVFAGYAYMDSEITESPNPLEQDRELAFVPRNTFNLWTSYATGPWSFGAGAQFTDSYFVSSVNPTPAQAAMRDFTRYWLFSAMAGYRVNETVSLQLNATNLADERYVERALTGHFSPGPGRAILLGLHLDL
jgi:catecholate siderophore receptor